MWHRLATAAVCNCCKVISEVFVSVLFVSVLVINLLHAPIYFRREFCAGDSMHPLAPKSRCTESSGSDPKATYSLEHESNDDSCTATLPVRGNHV